MALTALVKEELAQYEASKASVRKAEVSTILRFTGALHIVAGRIVIESEVDTEQTAQRMQQTIAEIYGHESELTSVTGGGLRRGGRYIVRVDSGGEALARQTGLLDLRLDVMAKSREVRGVDRVVVRDGETIAHLLERMGASESLRTWREQRTRKEVRATANRLANFDDANLRRSAQAAVAAGARVERALHILGDDVPEHLRYAGQLRVANKQASLDELGRLADPPLTKDAIAGRIRRLLVMADKRAQELGIPGTELKEDIQGAEAARGVSSAAPTGA